MNRAESSHSLIGLRIENPRVRGSIPRLGTIYSKASQQCEAFLFSASGLVIEHKAVVLPHQTLDLVAAAIGKGIEGTGEPGRDHTLRFNGTF